MRNVIATLPKLPIQPPQRCGLWYSLKDQMIVAAVLNRASVPIMEALTRTEELRERPCRTLYSRRKKLNVEDPKPT